MRGAALAFALIPAPALAQGDFGADIDAVLAPAGAAAPFLHCTAVFQAFRALAGDGTDTGDTARAAALDLAVLSTLVRSDETGASPEAAMEELRPVVVAATELYVRRLVANDAATGRVMDDELDATLAACTALRQDYMPMLDEALAP